MGNIIWKVSVFVITTIVITGLLAVIQQKINFSFEKIVLAQLAPAIAFLFTILIFKDLALPINLSFDKTIAGKILLSLAFPLLLFGVSFFIGKLIGIDVKITENLSSLLQLMLFGVIVGGFGEEIGWRSFLQPTLEKKNSVLLASIIVGTIWGLWHIGHYSNGLMFMVGFLLFTVSASIILAWILRGTEYNLLVSAIFHISINLGFVVFFKNSLTDSKFMLTNGIVWLIPAIIIILLTSKDLIKA